MKALEEPINYGKILLQEKQEKKYLEDILSSQRPRGHWHLKHWLLSRILLSTLFQSAVQNPPMNECVGTRRVKSENIKEPKNKFKILKYDHNHIKKVL